jgi:hypothetical protein
MPTIFIIFGFVFKFYSDDHEPIHVHVIKDGHEAKFNVVPDVLLVYNHGFKSNELKMIESIIEENVEVIYERWKNYFER